MTALSDRDLTRRFLDPTTGNRVKTDVGWGYDRLKGREPEPQRYARGLQKLADNVMREADQTRKQIDMTEHNATLASEAIAKAISSPEWPTLKITPDGRMARETLSYIGQFSHDPKVKEFLESMQTNGYRVDSLEWHFFKYRYQYGEDLRSVDDLNARFDSVFNDDNARVMQKGNRYVIYSATYSLFAVIDAMGRRITSYTPSSDEITEFNEVMSWILVTLKR